MNAIGSNPRERSWLAFMRRWLEVFRCPHERMTAWEPSINGGKFRICLDCANIERKA